MNYGNLTMALQRQDITGAMKDVITRIKGLIQTEKFTTEEKTTGGWKYGGRELETEIELLNATMDSEYKVSTRPVFVSYSNLARCLSPTSSISSTARTSAIPRNVYS